MRLPLFVSLLSVAPALAAEPAQTAAPAEVPAVNLGERHLELGLSAEYAYGLGRETNNALMTDLTYGTVPLTLDASYLLGPHLALGAYAGWGPMFVNGCHNGVSCSGSSLRFGLRARYRFGESTNLTPWFSLGAGYERMVESDSFQTTTVDSSVSGFELLRLEVGAEHRVSSGLCVGPLVTGSLGRYTARSLSGGAVDIGQGAFHYWVAAGLRGSYSL